MTGRHRKPLTSREAWEDYKTALIAEDDAWNTSATQDAIAGHSAPVLYMIAAAGTKHCFRQYLDLRRAERQAEN
jgi:hypothetical protein